VANSTLCCPDDLMSIIICFTGYRLTDIVQEFHRTMKRDLLMAKIISCS